MYRTLAEIYNNPNFSNAPYQERLKNVLAGAGVEGIARINIGSRGDQMSIHLLNPFSTVDGRVSYIDIRIGTGQYMVALSNGNFVYCDELDYSKYREGFKYFNVGDMSGICDEIQTIIQYGITHSTENK